MNPIKQTILFLLLTLSLSGCNNGADTKIDQTTPRKVLQTEAEKDNPDALCQLALHYGSGTNGYDFDEEKAGELFQKAAKYADKGIASAQFCRGMCYLAGNGVEPDVREAVRWFHKSAEQDFADAQFMLGMVYMNGMNAIPQSDEEAVKWVRRAATLGHADAQYLLGEWYCTGTYVPADAAEGYRWIKLAADQGLPEAKEALARFEIVPKTESRWAAFIRKIPDSTGILVAVADGNLTKIKELVQNDPSLLKKTFGDDKMSLVHIVSVNPDDIEVLKYLIEQDADVRAKTAQNWTPVVYACRAGNHEAIRYLLANGSREPHEDCLNLPEELQQLVRMHAAMSPERRVGTKEIRTEDQYGNLIYSRTEDITEGDISRTLSIQDQLIKERSDQIRKMLPEIVTAKSGRDLKNYVIPKKNK